MSSRRLLHLASIALLAGGCRNSPTEPAPEAASKPHRDPAAELRREHDQWWQSLAATYDLDGDGRITRAEFTRADDAGFARLDRDHDGVITRADFDTRLAPLPDLTLPMLLIRAIGGREATSIGIEEALAGMAQMDKNGDGRVDRAEFEAAAQGGINGIDPFATFLAGMDEDHDGLLSQPEVERWFRRRDADHDGRLVFRERDREGPAPAEGFIARGAREPAPDFRAVPLDGGAATWQLSSHFGERPIALIFGSFT